MIPVHRQVIIAVLCMSSLVLLSSCGGGSAGEGGGSTTEGSDTANSIEALPGTLIIVGDSIMAGCADSLDRPSADYSKTTAHLIAQQGLRVINLSRSGNSMSAAVSQRVDGGINFTQGDKRGTAIWITLGVNDFIFKMSNLEQYRDRYLTVLRRIEPVEAQKIFCATPLISGLDYEHASTPEGVMLEDYRQVVRDIADSGHCTLVDTSQWFDATEIYDECNMPDKLHLGEDGHTRYSNKLLEKIRGNY